MLCTERKDERIKMVDHQIDKSEPEHYPYRSKKNFTSSSMLIKECYDIAHPGEHCKKHKKKIKKTVEIEVRIKFVNAVVFVKNSPCDVCNKVAVCRRKKMAVADNALLFVVLQCNLVFAAGEYFF